MNKTKNTKTGKSFYQVCDMLRTSAIGLEKLCRTNNASYAEFVSFISPDAPNYDKEKADYYRRARMDRKRFLAETLLTLSDEMLATASNPQDKKQQLAQAYKLRIDTVKWFLGDNKLKKAPNRTPMPKINIIPYCP